MKKHNADLLHARYHPRPFNTEPERPISERDIPTILPEYSRAVLDRQTIVDLLYVSPSGKWFTCYLKGVGKFDVSHERLKQLAVIEILPNGKGQKKNWIGYFPIRFDGFFEEQLVVGNSNEWLAYKKSGRWVIVASIESISKNGNSPEPQ